MQNNPDNFTKPPKRVLLKISGEVLGSGEFGMDSKVMSRIANEIKDVVDSGVQVGLVLGGGNLFRGSDLAETGLNRVTCDHIGMLATMMNGLAMRDTLQKSGVGVRILSSIPILGVAEVFDSIRAVDHLESGKVVVMIGGTGNPFFTTDSCACLRAIEVDADLVLKATKVDYIFSADPKINKDAIKYDTISFSDVLSQDIRVMDHTAICLARDNNKPIRVFNVEVCGNIIKAVNQQIGTLVHP